MDNQFPRMVFKQGGPHEIHGGRFDYHIVADAGELSSALADGWHLSTADATGPAKASTVVEPEDDAPPTRTELEAKARELKIAFDGRTSDARLAAKITAALKA